MKKITYKFNTQNELLEMMSKSIIFRLKQAIRSKGTASLVVSGGSTPIELFKTLSVIDLPWEHVTVGLCDERWIPSSHEDSNEHLVKKYLLQHKAQKANFIGMYTPDLTLEEAEIKCSEEMRSALEPIDVILLGMGTDGHTASLFPNNDKLSEAFHPNNQSYCISIEPFEAPYRRMSLTRNAILSANAIYLHFEGEKKRLVYQKAIHGDNIYEMPIRSILNQEDKDIEIYYR